MSSSHVKTVTCDGLDIPFKFIKKNNKYTYFYFNEPGIIKVHMAKRTSMKHMIKHIEDEQIKLKERFIEAQPKSQDPTLYTLFNKTYKRLDGSSEDVSINEEESTISIPSEKALQIFEKRHMERAIDTLIKTYKNNGYINLDNVTYRFSYMKSRYGSCHKQKRKIHINTHLLHYDVLFLEYVFCHEICHLEVANHSKAFYALLERIYPNYKSVRKRLKKIRLR
ncbi:MAG: M48 family metallopeptidase [Candidatus Izemoplasma sp.]|nr:M48 family metallopeptidase [Candidatus Izemoplasma sp.]